MNSHKEGHTGSFLGGQQANSYFPAPALVSYKGDMDVVRKLVEDRVKDLGLNYAEVSRRLDRNETYLQQFLKRGSPRELPERERILLAEILKVAEDQLRGPSTVLPKRNYGRKHATPPHSGLDHAHEPPQAHDVGSPAVVVPGSAIFGMQADFPVFGTMPSGHEGALVMTETAVDYIARPPALLRVRDGYGLIVSGDAMAPEHKEGSIALVNPHLPPRIGDSCVFRSARESSPILAIIREYRGQTDNHWKVRQHNPSRDLTLKKSDWPICHRTVGNYFP